MNKKLADGIARIKANSGYNRPTQRAADIRALVEAVEAVDKALEDTTSESQNTL